MKVQLTTTDETTVWVEESVSIRARHVVEMDEAKHKEFLALQEAYEEMQGYLTTLQNEAIDNERKIGNEEDKESESA